VFTREKGGFFHDGRFATLADVVAHFNTQFSLALTAEEQSDLVQFLKSL
jgi:cytochrome c peroxidase